MAVAVAVAVVRVRVPEEARVVRIRVRVPALEEAQDLSERPHFYVEAEKVVY